MNEQGFLRLMEREQYDGILYIFPDYLVRHKDYAINGWRSYSMYGLHMNYPRAAGIVIGMSEVSPFKGLHTDLSPCPKNNDCDPFFCNRILIDESLEEIRSLIAIHRYAKVVCMFDEMPDIGGDVRRYVTEELARFTDEK